MLQLPFPPKTNLYRNANFTKEYLTRFIRDELAARRETGDQGFINVINTFENFQEHCLEMAFLVRLDAARICQTGNLGIRQAYIEAQSEDQEHVQWDMVKALVGFDAKPYCEALKTFVYESEALGGQALVDAGGWETIHENYSREEFLSNLTAAVLKFSDFALSEMTPAYRWISVVEVVEIANVIADAYDEVMDFVGKYFAAKG